VAEGLAKETEEWRRMSSTIERRAFAMVETMAQDIRYTFRTLSKSPGFTTTSVATLALSDKRFKLGSGDSERLWFTVVGVVGDMRRQSLENAPAPQMFEPLAQNPSRLETLLVRQ
jgi:hypothetical protein